MKIKRFLGISLFAFSLFLFVGCMNMKVVAKYDTDIPTPQKVTKWVWFWGLVEPKDIQTDSSCESICIVTAKNNIGHILVSAISLGIAVPVTVEYQCCPFEPESGSID